MAKGSNSVTKTAVWVLLGLLILGLGGFGATNLSGTIRSVGTVGDKSLSVDTYARQLQQEIRAIEAQIGETMPFARAQEMGIDRQVLRNLVTMRALDHEADQLGLSVGDESLRDRILEIRAFQGLDGAFDRDGYAFALQQAGLSEAEFETQLREEVARTLLQGALLSGLQMPGAYADTLMNYVGERRSFTWSRLDEGRLDAPLPEPEDADLRAYYDENIDEFTRPEAKSITYAVLRPDDLIDSVEIEEDALRAAYEERSDEFNQPERRLVERLVYLDETAAAEAKARLGEGTAFEDLVAARGLALEDVDLGDATEASLDAAGAEVFAAEVGEVVGPLPTGLGPALFRVNGVLPAMTVPFEEAEPLLRPQIAADRALRLVDAQAQSYDDMLAGGATLEDLAADTDMQLGTVDWHPESDAEIAGYAAFRAAAAAVTLDDFPQIAQLDDGGLFALRLDEVVPAQPAPFEEVRDAVAEAWRAAEITEALRAQAEALLPRLAAGESFAELDLDAVAEEDMLRSDFIPGVPQGFLRRVFEMAQGEAAVLAGNGAVFIVRLDAVGEPGDGEDMQQMAAQLQAQASEALAADVFDAVAGDITARANPQINQQALQAVHVNLP